MMPSRRRAGDDTRVADTRVADTRDPRDDETILAGAFDADFYRAEYPDIGLPRAALLGHFCRAGWWEGRAPNAGFDTVAYLQANPGLAASGVNPLLHSLRIGHPGAPLEGPLEGWVAAPAARPSRATARLFGRPVTDWVARLRPHVALDFYADLIDGADLTDGLRAGPAAARMAASADLVAHFAYRGWRLGLSPNPRFDMRRWRAEYPEAVEALVNPLLVALERGAWPPPTRAISRPISRPMSPLDGHPDGGPDVGGDIDPERLAVVAAAFSAAFYLHRYPDIRAAGIDPLAHYMATGWREGRDPTAAFDTRYYLAANADVAAAGVDPFWHYLVAGRREGRAPRRPADAARRAIAGAWARALPPDTPPADAPTPDAMIPDATTPGAESGPPEAPLAADALAAMVRRIVACRGLVLSFSHDCHALSVGGVQIVVGEEQRRCTEGGWSYLHVSPARPMLTLAPPAPGFLVRLAHDGVVLGLCALDDLVDRLAARAGGRAVAVLHSLLGFDPGRIAAALAALAPERVYFWLHEYSALCPGFNLLRNDVTFCGAPPPDSMACRVCAYGGARAAHLAEFAALFAAHGLRVLAPSETALAIWRGAVSWPHLSAEVRPHWSLRAVDHDFLPASDRECLPAPGLADPAGRRRGAARIAFVGAALPGKGWPAFRALAARLLGDPRYHLIHLASENAGGLPEVEFVRLRVTPADRFAAIRELRALRVDYVVVPSPWPETFCFVAHEALVAGARVLCLADSGHVAVLVARTRRGRIFSDTDALGDFLASGEAIRALDRPDSAAAPDYEIAASGTTAGLILEAPADDERGATRHAADGSEVDP